MQKTRDDSASVCPVQTALPLPGMKAVGAEPDFCLCGLFWGGEGGACARVSYLNPRSRAVWKKVREQGTAGGGTAFGGLDGGESVLPIESS